MAKSFVLHIHTPAKTIFSGNVTSIVVPGADGYLGVLAEHAPLISALKDGTVTTHDDAGITTSYRLKGRGFLEVLNNNAILLLDSAEPVI